MATAAAQPVPGDDSGDVLKALGRPRVGLMLLMGISSGLPFMLIGNTLGFWLADDNIKLAMIGALSWVGLTYSIKFVWGAMVDRIPLPLLGRMGRRRSWMLVSQIVAGAGLIGMGLVDPKTQLGWMVVCAIVAAVGAATQDTAMDAWRIETATDADELGLLTSAYSLGYRFALILTEAVILMIAKRLGWPITYVIYGSGMAVGIIAVLLAKEPANGRRGDGSQGARRGAPAPRRGGLRRGDRADHHLLPDPRLGHGRPDAGDDDPLSSVRLHARADE